MPVVKLTAQTMPQSSEGLREILQNALERTSPLEDLVQVVRDLASYELQHELESPEFFARFQRGEMGDQIEFIRWANKYEIYQEMKADMDHLFELLTQYALPVAAA
jgi:hypothetical protein